MYFNMTLFICLNRAIKRSNCFKKYGHDKGCHTLNSPFLLIVACIELVLSQLPNFHKLSFLSIIAAIMSFVYSTIGMGLSIAKIAGETSFRLIIK
ncbi:putative amino acid transporter, transmembrane domain-containing protein [Helianthus annuus]|nr:putative amino acid transporter, transmembrane domain-containing protein [Helianthus annuus]